MIAVGQRPQRRYEVPVAGVLGEVAELVVWVEQQVLAPAVGNVIDRDLPHLKADDFVLHVPDRPAAAERNQRLDPNRFAIFLQDRDARVLGVEDRLAALAYDVDRVAERANGRGGAAVWTVDRSNRD